MASELTIQSYIDEIRRIPPLPADCEAIFARRLMRQDDLVAREVLVVASLRFVVRTALSSTSRGLDLLDLVTEGNMGLLRAVEEFDPDQGVCFSTSAAWWIQKTIHRALHGPVPSVYDCDWMNLMIRKWKRADAKLEGRLGRKATLDELSSHLSISRKRLQIIQNAERALAQPSPSPCMDNGMSLEAFFNDTSTPTPDDTATSRGHVRALCLLTGKLRQREPTLLRLRFDLEIGQPLTFQEIATGSGLSPETTSEIKYEALRALADLAAAYYSRTSWYELADVD